MAVRRSTIKREVGPALYQVMEPGDQIIAGTWATTGPGPWLEMLAVAPFVALGIAGITTGTNPAPFVAGVPSLLSLAILFIRRPVFVAVTQRQLICYRLARPANTPDRLLFRAPLPLVRVTSLGGSWPRWRSIRYYGPGVESGGLRLNLVGGLSWRRDLDEVLVALHAQGARVAGLPPGR